MTVSTTHNSIEHVAIGGVDTYTYDFMIQELGDCKVTFDGIDYTGTFALTALGNPAGGNMILDTPIGGGDLGKTIKIQRKTVIKQETDYISFDGFPAESHEAALDRLTLITQDMNIAFVESSSDIVTYENLDLNGDVGWLAGQVADGLGTKDSLDFIQTGLNNHKSSDDHDSRYDSAGSAGAVQSNLDAHTSDVDGHTNVTSHIAAGNPQVTRSIAKNF